MNKYNYLEAITNDIECWMDKDGDPFNISQFKDRDEAAEFLNNELWDEDSITGNGGNYYDIEYQCEEYLAHNIEWVAIACEEFCIDMETIIQHLHANDLARYLDCTIRCYLLARAVDNALETWESYGYKYGGEENGT